MTDMPFSPGRVGGGFGYGVTGHCVCGVHVFDMVVVLSKMGARYFAEIPIPLHLGAERLNLGAGRET